MVWNAMTKAGLKGLAEIKFLQAVRDCSRLGGVCNNNIWAALNIEKPVIIRWTVCHTHVSDRAYPTWEDQLRLIWWNLEQREM